MSRPDAASGSLESILASIRKSLSEQSTDTLTQAPDVAADQPKEAKARRTGLTQRLAGAGSEAPAAHEAGGSDDLSDLLEEQAPAPAPIAAPVAAPAPAPGPAATTVIKEDPLWFLTRTEEPAAPPAEASPPAPPATQSGAKIPPTEDPPTLTRPEVLRASMPPFFGSTAEVAKPEAPPEPKSAPVAPKPPPPMPAAPPVAQAVAPPAPSVEPSAGLARPASPAPLRNGKALSVADAPAEAGNAAPGDTPHTRTIEAAVLDLLKPMLRQWLDQNMPRLVADALKDEAMRVRTPGGDAKKD
jgi:cell pole-organizing protein PopZ